MNAARTKPLTASQEKTLAYIRKNGRVLIGYLSGGGYNSSSVDALVKKGVLVVEGEPYQVRCSDGIVRDYVQKYANVPSEDTK